MKDDKTEVNPQGQHPGTLYVVATPIGNLEDITLRALRILKEVKLIAAEEPDHTRQLCNHYGIKVRVTAYNQHNNRSKGPELIERLYKGDDIAVVTSAGTPTVSDPGALLISMALEQGLRVSPIPGPSAAITAISVCGLKVDRFVFLGFLPNRSGKRRKYLQDLTHEPRAMVIYEAPHRVLLLLNDLLEVFGDRQIAVMRELTKVYEEIKRGTISEIIQGMDMDKVRGEFTLILAGSEKGDGPAEIDLTERIEEFLEDEALGAKEIAMRLSDELGVNYRAVYKECLNLMRERGQ